jgi:signal transduction histidine kinase
MQIKNMEDNLTVAAPNGGPAPPLWCSGLPQTKVAIESALKDLRALSANIELPDIARLELSDIAERVVRDLQVKTGVRAELSCQGAPVPASFRVKVALYRLLQESLANTVRHAPGKPAMVLLRTTPNQLHVEVHDQGSGFDPVEAASKGRLGLRGMQQRVEVLGGVFALHSTPGAGTLIRVCLPLEFETPNHEPKHEPKH